MNYYRRYVGDYLRDTARLSMLEHGAYNLLLDYYYADEKPLPIDHDELYTMVRAMSAADRKAVDKILRLYFTEEPDGYHQKRVDHEITVSQKARDNGKGGGRPPGKTITGTETGTETGLITGTKPDDKPDAKPLNETGLQTETLTGSVHPPTTNHQPPASNQPTPKEKRTAALALLGDVPPQLLDDWLMVRKAKKAPLTPTAVSELQREAGKAGLSLEAAVRVCCARNWQNFNASWDWQEKPTKVNGMTPYQQMQVEKHEETKRFTEAIYGPKRDDKLEPIDITPERVD